MMMHIGYMHCTSTWETPARLVERKPIGIYRLEHPAELTFRVAEILNMPLLVLISTFWFCLGFGFLQYHIPTAEAASP